jgi:hypothetical protein
MSLACKQVATLAGCLVEAGQPGVPVVIHYEYRDAASGNPQIHATRYTDAAGTPIALAAGQSVIAGACPVVTTDVEQQLLCDDTDGNPATPVVQFIRRYTRTYNAGTGALLSEVVADFQLDGVTAYTVAGTIAQCAADLEYDEETVCDSAGVSHIRRTTTLDNGQSYVLGFFSPTTGAPTTPTGAVGPCPVCVPAVPVGVVSTWG